MRRAIPSSSPVSHPVQPEESTRPFLSLPAALWRTAVRPQKETVRFASRPVCRKPAAPRGRQGNLAYRSGEISVTAAPRRQARGFPPFPSLHPALPSVCELSEPFSRPASHKRPPSAIRQNLFPAPFSNPQHLRTLHPVFSSSVDMRRNRGFDRMHPA